MIRASKVGLAVLCPQSVMPPSIIIESGGEEATLGTAAHAWLTRRIQGNHVEVEEIAEEFNVDLDELGRLCWFGWRCWNEIKQWFPNPEMEVAIEAGSLSGHIDLISVVHG